MAVSWHHKVERWEDPAETWDASEDERAAILRRLEAKLDSLSEGGWELVQQTAMTGGSKTYIWTLWKRKVDP